MLWVIVFLFISLFLTTFTAINYLSFQKNGTLSIKPDTNAGASTKILHQNAELSKIGTKILARLISKKAQVGIYEFKKGEMVTSFAKKVKSGNSIPCYFTFVPGLTVYQYIQELNQNPNFTGKITIKISEGQILPETYSFKCFSSKNSVLNHAKTEMEAFLKSSLESVDFKVHFLKNQNEVLTLASIIEKETSIASERRDIASVFQNRLKNGMRLQTDPTVIYQQSNGKGFLERPISKADLHTKGIYNTYTSSGLPPAPIANPSKESILSALNPNQTKYLYFVAKNQNPQNGHNFSKTYQQHLHYVKIYRKPKSEYL